MQIFRPAALGALAAAGVFAYRHWPLAGPELTGNLVVVDLETPGSLISDYVYGGNEMVFGIQDTNLRRPLMR